VKKNILGQIVMGAALLAGTGAYAAATGPAPDVAKQIVHEVRMYPNYTIWDDVSFNVNGGNVVITGAVSQPFKKTDIERLVSRVPGVTSVTNRLEVLPLSNFDDRLRLQVARAIYSDPTLSRYGIQAVGPIHIIVDNGHVTLTGMVNSELEKNVAGMRAASAGLSFGSVTNNLQVENQVRKG
jgi:osmotically-inducible protein OsmY